MLSKESKPKDLEGCSTTVVTYCGVVTWKSMKVVKGIPA